VTLGEVEHRRGPGRLPRATPVAAGPWRRSASVADAKPGSHASLTHIADIVGDAWTPLVVAAAFFGRRRFDDFQQELGIATNILASRLELLVARRIMERRLYVRHPPRHEYRLTGKGRDLFHYAVVLNAWGDRWLAPPSGPAYQLVHRGCGRVVAPLVRCGHCHEPLRPNEVSYAPGQPTAAGKARSGPGARGRVRRSLARRTTSA
jgi:DNA-binding HxlR family transcriptional regulator